MKLNEQQKKFFAASAAYITGKQASTKITGDPEKLKATRDALDSSKALYEELKSPDASLADVMRLVEEKNHAAKRFYRCTGFDWIL